MVGWVDDSMVFRLLKAAIAAFDGPEGKLGRCLINQTWRLDLEGFDGNIRLPLAPVNSILGISYTAAGVSAMLGTASYTVTGLESADCCVISPVLKWPFATAVSIAFVAGFGESPCEVPEDIRSAILSTVGAGYGWRESQILTTGSLADNPEVSGTVDRWRIRGFG